MNGITPKIKKNIILLKGKNKLKKEKWKGLEVTLNYFGCMQKDFGISKKKLTMREAIQIEQMNHFNFHKFHNKTLKSLTNTLQLTNQTFKLERLAIKSKENNRSDYCFNARSIENELVNKLEQVCKERLLSNQGSTINIKGRNSSDINEYYSVNVLERYRPCFSESKIKKKKQLIKLPELKQTKLFEDNNKRKM